MFSTFFENPVLQRELLVKLRLNRSFLMLLMYQLVLGALVVAAWPQESRLSLVDPSDEAGRLFDLFFLGQYILVTLMTPSFAAGTIAGEKERQTYEMMLASPLQPESIVFGKLLAALTQLAILIFTSLPTVMICLPLGGQSLYEVLAAYLGLLIAVCTFGMISIACSSFFQKTTAALVTSYVLILPIALLGVLFWMGLADNGALRLKLTVTVLPGISAAICIALFYLTSARLLYPPDVGSEGKEVFDLEEEQRTAVGLIIQPHLFPDRLFAPPKRTSLMDDNANPVYDKEIRSEVFSQGTRMLRYVFQVSFILEIPLMAICLYLFRQYAYLYIGFVVIFNVLLAPAFNAGSITSERERGTLDLLLTTTISPRQILWGKLFGGLRVSGVLTGLLLWPLLLACVLVVNYWSNLLAVAAFIVIVVLTAVTNSVVSLFFSTVFQKTSVSMMATYSAIIAGFFVPVAVVVIADSYFADHKATPWVKEVSALSPFMAAYDVPFYADNVEKKKARWLPAEKEDADFLHYRFEDWLPFVKFVGVVIGINALLLSLVGYLFNMRWRVSSKADNTPATVTT